MVSKTNKAEKRNMECWEEVAILILIIALLMDNIEINICNPFWGLEEALVAPQVEARF